LKRVALVFFLTYLLSGIASAQKETITGLVANGTTHKPAANADVTLLRLEQGMQEEARTKTNAKGEFRFNVEGGTTQRLVRVHFQDIDYLEALPAGTKSTQITVYNSAPRAPGLEVMDQSEVYQATDQQLQVFEIFRVRNAGFPPTSQPSFDFYLPEGATLIRAQGVSSSGMPTRATAVPLSEKDKYSLKFPVRPGVTQFEVVFTMPYSGKVTMQRKFAFPPKQFYVVTAEGIQFASPKDSGFQETKEWPIDSTVIGINKHVAEAANKTAGIGFELSGKGLLPEQPDAQQSGGQGGGQGGGQQAQRQGPGGGLGTPNDRPDPLQNGQWIFLALLAVFLTLGGVYVYVSNPQVAPAAAGNGSAKNRPDLLDAMKEEIFQLESDRLQGKISSSDYESTKAALDKTLKRAMQRQGAKK
jgi:5-hydroxyisourate hydrolase-like protein (transthyretin family)